MMMCPDVVLCLIRRKERRSKASNRQRKTRNGGRICLNFISTKKGSLRRRNNSLSNKRVSLKLMYQYSTLPRGDGQNLLAKDNSLGIKSGGILKRAEVHRWTIERIFRCRRDVYMVPIIIKEKNPMSRTQWRIFQRKKKAKNEAA